MARNYRMRRRAESRDETRERIVRATMQLHDRNGVAATTFAEIADAAGVGPATVHRHFPSLGALVMACGAHVWQEMRPPVPPDASAAFEGIVGRRARLHRLIEELDAFYARGAFRLGKAAEDRHRVPELDGFLRAVDAGLEALVREALAPCGDTAGPGPSEAAVRVVMTLIALPVWRSFDALGLDAPALAAFRLRLLECGLAALEPEPAAPIA